MTLFEQLFFDNDDVYIKVDKRFLKINEYERVINTLIKKYCEDMINGDSDNINLIYKIELILNKIINSTQLTFLIHRYVFVFLTTKYENRAIIV